MVWVGRITTPAINITETKFPIILKNYCSGAHVYFQVMFEGSIAYDMKEAIKVWNNLPLVLQDPSESVFWAGFYGLNTS